LSSANSKPYCQVHNAHWHPRLLLYIEILFSNRKASSLRSRPNKSSSLAMPCLLSDNSHAVERLGNTRPCSIWTWNGNLLSRLHWHPHQAAILATNILPALLGFESPLAITSLWFWNVSSSFPRRRRCQGRMNLLAQVAPSSPLSAVTMYRFLTAHYRETF
jgi:hypothetical protein